MSDINKIGYHWIHWLKLSSLHPRTSISAILDTKNQTFSQAAHFIHSSQNKAQMMFWPSLTKVICWLFELQNRSPLTLGNISPLTLTLGISPLTLTLGYISATLWCIKTRRTWIWDPFLRKHKKIHQNDSGLIIIIILRSRAIHKTTPLGTILSIH